MLVYVDVYDKDHNFIEQRTTRLTEAGKLWLANFTVWCVARDYGIQVYRMN